MLTKEEQKLADDRFRQLCKLYETDKSKAIWDEMFFLVNQACDSMVKTLLKGVKVKDLDELILDSTLDVMKKLRKEFDNNNHFELKHKLVTFCRSYCLYPVYKPARKFNDKIISLDSYLECHSEGELFDQQRED